METVILKLSHDSLEAVKEFLKTLPAGEVQLVLEEPVEVDIPYVSDEEQAEIEELFKDPDCHIVSSREKVFVEFANPPQ
ncbi:MAG: hypothetical protein HQK56_11960 [Deltaproteobacteria bacterium]|nr:hypothetical protein [Deltaproteobacteria bacterium]